MTRRLHVSFVGGVERTGHDLVALGDELGVDVEFHGGHTRGQGAARLVSLVQRSDFLVIITGTNSHNAVQVAKREAARLGIPMRILKTCGVGTARALLKPMSLGMVAVSGDVRRGAGPGDIRRAASPGDMGRAAGPSDTGHAAARATSFA